MYLFLEQLNVLQVPLNKLLMCSIKYPIISHLLFQDHKALMLVEWCFKPFSCQIDLTFCLNCRVVLVEQQTSASIRSGPTVDSFHPFSNSVSSSIHSRRWFLDPTWSRMAFSTSTPCVWTRCSCASVSTPHPIRAWLGSTLFDFQSRLFISL